MASAYSLEAWEVTIIKGLLEHSHLTQQQIVAYFSRPSRTIHANVIREIKYREIFGGYPAATRAECEHFLDLWNAGYREACPSAVSGTYSFGYSFYPVGQGLFSAGWVSRANAPPFRWVYDCGTSRKSSRRLLLRSLASLRADVRSTGGESHLDLVILSHFDEDHVSGLVDLLRIFSVGTLLIPYLSPWERLVVALTEDARSASDFLAFMMAPAAFLLGLPGVEIGRIVLVPPSDGPAPPPMPVARPDEGPGDRSGDLFLKFDPGEIPDESAEAGGPDGGLADDRVEVLAPGGTLTIPNLWEFVPFNDPSRAHLADDAFRSSARGDADRLRHARSDKAREDALTALRKVYEDTFGSGSKNKNIISLFLYSGPLGNVRLIAASEELLRHRLLRWCRGRAPCGTDRDRFGQLLTGDGYLKTKKQFDSFFTFYTRHGRLRRGGYFQVMHHGSKANWHLGLARRVRPLASLFSSDPSGQYRHPHADVLRDFSRFHPRQIDARDGWRLKGDFVFL